MSDDMPRTMRTFDITVGGNMTDGQRELIEKMIIIETCMAELSPRRRKAVLAYLLEAYGGEPQ